MYLEMPGQVEEEAGGLGVHRYGGQQSEGVLEAARNAVTVGHNEHLGELLGGGRLERLGVHESEHVQHGGLVCRSGV